MPMLKKSEITPLYVFSSFFFLPGDIVRLDVRVVGKPEPVVEWFKNGKQVEDEGRFIIIDEVEDQDKELFSLLIERCKLEDDAVYMVVAMSEAGKDTSSCHLCVTRRTVPEEFKDEMEEVHSKLTTLILC